jgi:DNA modification methylase
MLIQADARQIPLADNSVQCCVTSPPYWGLRDYGVNGQLGLESTLEEYVANMVAVFREVRRVLRDDGTLWLNLGDSYASDTKGSGGTTPKQQTNHGSFYEPRRMDHGLKSKDLVGIPWSLAFALQADGWYLRSDIIWAKPNPMPESVTDRPTKSHEYIFLLTKSARYFFDQEAVREVGSGLNGGVFSRAYAEAQPSHGAMRLDRPHVNGRNLRSVWTIPTQPYPEVHFATFPEELAKRCILAGTSAWGACSREKWKHAGR